MRRFLPFVAIAMSTVTLVLLALMYVDGRDTDQAIIDNRIAAQRDSCQSRNAERRVHRQNLNDQIKQTKQISDRVFEQLELDRPETLDALRDRREKLHPIGCREAIQALRELEP